MAQLSFVVLLFFVPSTAPVKEYHGNSNSQVELIAMAEEQSKPKVDLVVRQSSHRCREQDGASAELGVLFLIFLERD